MAPIFSISLSHGEDFCGCWWTEIDEVRDAEIVSRLAAANIGLFRNEAGALCRAFFVDEEIDDAVMQAQEVTGCTTSVREFTG